MLFQWFQRGG